MSNGNKNFEEPEKHEAGGENEENAKQSENRRDFIKRAGDIGITAGLAHFLLIGGSAKAWASPDACPNYNNDVCQPSASNPDTCRADNYGDECPNGGNAEDVCPAPYTPAAGDVCSPAFSAWDWCEVSVGSTSDIV